MEHRRLALACVIHVTAMLWLAGCATSASRPDRNLTHEATVSASAWENVAAGGWRDFPPEKTVDGDTSPMSSWRAEAEEGSRGQWIAYDLGSTMTISRVEIAFLQGDSRIYQFEVALSRDGQTWTSIFSGKSSGETTDFETFDAVGESARYVRITGYGNEGVTEPSKFPHWINITETRILGR